ncbi:MAG: VanZ family protein [Bacteroidales bacterium]|nr:VanZ family protein [Bacteroidales bacterium]
MKRVNTLGSITKSLFFIYVIGILSIMVFTIHTEEINAPDYILGIAIDKVVHFIVFLPYPFLLWLAFNKRFSRYKNLFVCCLVPVTGLIFAIATEFLQSVNPARDFDYYDILANILSIIFASIVLNVIYFLNDRSR